MAECYELREFDTITYKKDYEGYDKYLVVSKKAYDELREYIEHFTYSDNEDDIRFFFQIGNKGITTQNYVGLIQLNSGVQFQILPKLDLDIEDDGFHETKKILLKMLKSLMNFSGKAFNNADINIQRMSLYEVFISMFLQKVSELIKHGLKSSYVLVEDNIPFYKGKLKISEHIKHNAANKTKFYLQYDEFILNRPENRLIKSTLLKLLKLTKDSNNSKLISQELISFEEVELSQNYEKDFSQVVINRNMKEYETIMEWSKIILFDYSFTAFSGKNNAISLLFPMEKLFEAYVAKKVKAVFEKDDWNVTAQDRRLYLFDQPGKIFALRPDIVLKKDDRVIIMDTKWKMLSNNAGKNYGIKQSDMYQMYAYSKKYHTKEIWLLFPKTREIDSGKNIVFQSCDELIETDEKTETIVTVQFIDVGHIDECIISLKDKLTKQIKMGDIS